MATVLTDRSTSVPYLQAGGGGHVRKIDPLKERQPPHRKSSLPPGRHFSRIKHDLYGSNVDSASLSCLRGVSRWLFEQNMNVRFRGAAKTGAMIEPGGGVPFWDFEPDRKV